MAGFAAQAVLDKAATYGATVAPAAAEKVVESGLTTGTMLAIGAPVTASIAKMSVMGGVAAVAAAGTIYAGIEIAKQITDDFGKGPALRQAQREKDAASQQKHAAASQSAAQAKSEENKIAREEAIARGEYKNANEYEIAIRAKEKAEREAKEKKGGKK